MIAFEKQKTKQDKNKTKLYILTVVIYLVVSRGNVIFCLIAVLFPGTMGLSFL